MGLRPRLSTVILTGMVLLAGWTGANAQENLIAGPDLKTINTGTPGKGGEVTYTISRDMTNWNVTSALGNNAVVRSTTLPLLPSAFIVQPDFSLKLNTDLLESAEVTSADPQVVVYKIRNEAVWSDGTLITGDDFIYLWKTQNRRDCPDCKINAADGHDLVSKIELDSTRKVVTVTFSKPFVGWKGLFMFLFPAHLAAQHGTLAESYDWFANTVPTWSGGPYMIESFAPGQLVTMVPNPKWYGKEGPYLDQLKFRIITDPALQLTALENGEVDVIYPQGTTQDLVQQAAELDYMNVDFQMNPAANWYFAAMNLRGTPTADIAIRKAIMTAIDRDDMKAKTADSYLKNWPHMGSVMFLPSQPGYEDREVKYGYGSGKIDAAKKILTDAGYKIENGSLIDPKGAPVPSMRLAYPPGYPAISDIAKLIGTYIAPLGMKLDYATGPNSTADYVLTGNFSIYMSYFSQQVFPAVKAAQIWKTKAGQNYMGFSDPKVDTLIDDAIVKADPAESAALLAKADDIVLDAAVVFPIYQLSTALIYADRIVNLRDNPNQLGPTTNTSEWGVKK
ncbi:ABC transporter family substrate-binding protein (plasmid) [Agrobacterium deltaense]